MLDITAANTKNLGTSATPAPQKQYKRQKDAQNAAVRDIGPHAREGFEFTTFKCDGGWRWRATDEVPPPTAAQLKANGGKRSMLAEATSQVNEAMRNRQFAKAAEIVSKAVEQAGDGLDIPDFLQRAPETEEQKEERVALVNKTTGPKREIKNPPKATATPKKTAKANGSKTVIVSKLLTRKGGCTSADILTATGWPSVSVPAMAKAAGLTLRKENIGGRQFRYYGTPAK